jgi:hypothetical protein
MATTKSNTHNSIFDSPSINLEGSGLTEKMIQDFIAKGWTSGLMLRDFEMIERKDGPAELAVWMVFTKRISKRRTLEKSFKVGFLSGENPLEA